MFHVIPDAFCILRSKKGVYKQAKVYRYSDGLYVGACGGFVRLMRNGDCGTPDLSYVELEVPKSIKLGHDNLFRLTFSIVQL